MKAQPRHPGRAPLPVFQPAIRWARQHQLAFNGTVQGLVRAPVATLLTAAVIAVTLALPGVLYLAIENVQRLTHDWEGTGQISLFLKPSVSVKDAQRLAERISKQDRVGSAEVITPEAALEELRRHGGFGDAVKALDRNPLPAVVVVKPAGRVAADAVDALARDLARHGDVDLVQLDLEWVHRLHAWLAIAQRSVGILSILLGAGVLLIVGNTIRLAVLNRREEIVVIKLVGGTDGFVRRPFLYAGTLQGFVAGLLSWLLVLVATLLLDGHVRTLATLYHSDFALRGPGPQWLLALPAIGAALGWLGSLLAVGRHLKSVEIR